MKISNMIEKLNKMMKRHGDVDVYIQQHFSDASADVIAYVDVDAADYDEHEDFILISSFHEETENQ